MFTFFIISISSCYVNMQIWYIVCKHNKPILIYLCIKCFATALLIPRFASKCQTSHSEDQILLHIRHVHCCTLISILSSNCSCVYLDRNGVIKFNSFAHSNSKSSFSNSCVSCAVSLSTASSSLCVNDFACAYLARSWTLSRCAFALATSSELCALSKQ